MFRPSLSRRVAGFALIAGLALVATNATTDEVPATDGQLSGPSPARAPWNQDSDVAGMRVMGLLREASTFLDHDQMVQLTNLLAENREQAGEQRRQGPRQGRRGHRGPGPRGDEMRGPQVLQWADELQLSEEQRTAILEHHEAMRSTMQELRGDRSGPPSEMNRAKMREIQDANRAWLAQQLTETQLEQLDELRAQKRGARQGERQERQEARAVERLDALDQILDLSDTQRAALEKSFASERERLVALRDGARDREGLPDGEQMENRAEEIEAIRAATLEEVSGVLTDEQLELFVALQKLAPPRPRGPRGPGRPGGCGPGGD